MQFVDRPAEDLPRETRDRLAALPAVRLRLEFLFALLTIAGGVVLASGQGNDMIAAVAIFSALFGFVFVDWLRIFELPPLGAYLAMAGAAAYCVFEFWELQQQGAPQMVSVAMLLVLVQGILMMQRKSRRIFEQLAVFCLLELVVAAIFHDAIQFGLLMIPIALVGAGALSLLAIATLMEGIDLTLERETRIPARTRIGRLIQFALGRTPDPADDQTILTSASPESVISIYAAASSWSRFAVLTLSPAVLLVGAAFFFVLPRRIEPTRSIAGGPALVGFDDEIRMEQLGQVMQNPKTALKVKLNDSETQAPYQIKSSFYLRGQVLEGYTVDYSTKRPAGTWRSTLSEKDDRSINLPLPYFRQDEIRRRECDRVDVSIDCSAMSRRSLFAIAPYHRIGDAPQTFHSKIRWTLTRHHSEPPFPRVRYEFGSTAFFDGVQTPWIACNPVTNRRDRFYDFGLRSLFDRQTSRFSSEYLRDLLRYDREAVPSALQLANEAIDLIPETARNPYTIAVSFEEFLGTDPQFAYTLDLSSTPLPGVDPIEQFLSVDRKGHCQYFASSLALMLRSVGIPCRIVVGYRTEEFNPIGEYYIARQLHAHSWVEALIERNDVPADALLSGQPRAARYWLRLDPTPSVSELGSANEQGVDGLVNLANNIWEDYVVELDSERQGKGLVEAAGLSQVQDSYQGVLGTLKDSLISPGSRSQEGGQLRLQGDGLWKAGAIVMIIVAIAIALKQLSIPRFRRRKRNLDAKAEQLVPTLKFYAKTLEQLERIGQKRKRYETPIEFLSRIEFQDPSLRVLTDAFIDIRYGSRDRGDAQIEEALSALTQRIDRMVNHPP